LIGLLCRAFNGEVYVRVPAEVHAEVAREAFEKGAVLRSQVVTSNLS